MTAAWTATAAVAVSLICAPAPAQSLVDVAKRTEEGRKANPATAVAFDERDVNPVVAAREVLTYEITEERWKKMLAAEERIIPAVQKDATLWQRFGMLRARNVRTIERFLIREPLLLQALEGAGTNPHDYAYTAAAIGAAMAIIASDVGPAVLENLPPETKANVEFVRAREQEIKDVLLRAQKLQEKLAEAAR